MTPSEEGEFSKALAPVSQNIHRSKINLLGSFGRIPVRKVKAQNFYSIQVTIALERSGELVVTKVVFARKKRTKPVEPGS
jgi:hypothetical protein